jgi:cytochrome c2
MQKICSYLGVLGVLAVKFNRMIQFDFCMKRRQFFLFACLIWLTGCRKQYDSGQAVFQGECVKCHKLNGEGGSKGPDLTMIFSKKDEDYIRRYTMDPRSIKSDGTMPPSKISDRELDLMIQYLKEQNRPAKQ